LKKDTYGLCLRSLRRVTIDSTLGKRLLIVAAGVIILLAGCSVAIYRESLDRKKVALRTDSHEAPSVLVSLYGGENGALSYSRLYSDPSLASDSEPFAGKVAEVRLTLPDGSQYEIFIPSEKEFEDHDRTISQSQSTHVPLEIETGRVVPAFMEVTLYDE